MGSVSNTRRLLLIGMCISLVGLNVACSQEQSLVVTDDVIDRLRQLRAEPKFLDLPGAPAERERKEFEPVINEVIDRLVVGLRANPRKSWVFSQMEPAVARFHLEDTELRERCVAYLARALEIVGSAGSGGAFASYLIFI